jgi:uncharacterized Ntn-hydrolase superfamily protein
VTFSIVAFDADGPAWGVAVASKALCVGAHVPWGRAGVGAVATQAWHDLRYGYEGLALLQRAASADEVVAGLTAGDPEAVHRQLGVVDRAGRAASHTGPDCLPWAGGLAGPGVAVQGNLLAGPEVVEAMAERWSAAGPGPLAERLVGALLAGDRAGGDRRGRQSAAVRVWGGAAVPAGLEDAAVDLRVDDHPDPVPELRRLLGLHGVHYRRPAEGDLLPLEGAVAERVAAALRRRDRPLGDGGLQAALDRWAGEENLEHRLAPGRVDRLVLDLLEGRQRLATRASG